ncbi:MAG TPA: hypothetical protein VGQ99_13945 [Tepidisphaeraceae bacterium]|nr:hypothetical protein [Tepidisphaeraceae bacterium]
MCSPKQLEANRLNAQHSSGPKSEEGKIRSSQNSLKHGLCTTALLPTENPLAYDTFSQEMKDSLQPKSPPELMLVERITQLHWRLRRVSAAECEIFNQLDDTHLQKLQSHHTQALEKHYHENKYRHTAKIQIPPPQSPNLSPRQSSDILAHTFIHQDDKTNPFLKLQRYESHLQRSLASCYKELRSLQKHRLENPRPHEDHPQAPEVQNEPNFPPINYQLPTANSPLQNEPISPPIPAKRDLLAGMSFPDIERLLHNSLVNDPQTKEPKPQTSPR